MWDLQVSIPFYIALWNKQRIFNFTNWYWFLSSVWSGSLKVCIWDAIASCSFSFRSYHGLTAISGPSIGALHGQVFKILAVIVLSITSTFLLYVRFMLNNLKFIPITTWTKNYNLNVSDLCFPNFDLLLNGLQIYMYVFCLKCKTTKLSLYISSVSFSLITENFRQVLRIREYCTTFICFRFYIFEFFFQSWKIEQCHDIFFTFSSFHFHQYTCSICLLYFLMCIDRVFNRNYWLLWWLLTKYFTPGIVVTIFYSLSIAQWMGLNVILT